MRMTVEVDKKMIENVSARLGEFEKQAPAAVSRSLNRAVTNIRSNARKEVRKAYDIRAGDVSKSLKANRSTKNNLRAEMRSIGSPIGLDKFKISPKTINPRRKSQIKIGVRKGNLTRSIGAFVAELNGPKAFKRTGKHVYPTKGRHAGGDVKREKIQRLFGPSVPQMLENEKVTKVIEREGQKTFDKRLDHEIDRILSRGRGKA